MSRLVSRDPFARTEILSHRFYDERESATCAFCGQRKVTKNGRHYLYRFVHETDGGRRSSPTHMFCGVDCFRAYNA